MNRNVGRILQVGGSLALFGAWAAGSKMTSFVIAFAGMAAVLAGSVIVARSSDDDATPPAVLRG